MKKKILSICTFLIAAITSSYAQSPNFQYSLYDYTTDYYGNVALPLMGSSGYAFLYSTNDASDNTNSYIEWLDSQGNVIVNPVLIGVQNNTVGFALIQTADSGFIVGGVDYNSTVTNSYAFLIKTNSSGVQQWAKNYGQNFTSGSSIAQTKDGGYIIAGNTQSDYSFEDETNQTAIFVARTDSKGNTLWSNTYGDTTLQGFANSIHATSDGGFIITGSQLSVANNQDMYILKLDSSGNKQWDKYYGGSYANLGNSGMQTSDGGYIFAGGESINSGDSLAKILVVKTDDNGNASWSYLDTNFSSEAFSVIETKDGQFAIVGFNSVGQTDSIPQPESDAYLMKLSSAGKKLWSINPFVSQDVLFSQFSNVFQTADGGFLMPGYGYVYDANNTPYGAAILVKTDSNGNTSTVTTGISQIISPASNPNISVYPNPFSTQTSMNVSNTNLQNAVLLIFDMDGNIVKRIDNINSGTITIDRVNLNSGMYFYRLMNNNGIIGTGKLVAE